MKQVSPKYYDQKYFQFQSSSPNFSKKITKKEFHKKYHEISSLVPIKLTDHVCDYGCGTGDLSFLIYLKYQCNITAIDYSPDAIKICQSKLKLFKKNTYLQPTIKFLNKKNENIPQLKNIKAVFFCDVFEHLYPQEIKHLITQISQWGNPLIVIHTDNYNYLRFIQPIFNFLSLISGKTTLKKLRQNKQFNLKRHINLTTPKKLSHDMKQLGYKINKLTYPVVNTATIIQQLGTLSRFSFIITLSSFFLRHFPFLSPSFYSVYSKNHTNS